MSRNKSGFTLIELMVVIVIIGVLASLAIPRFTEASDKAKIAEAPRIIASFESAGLAAAVETASSSGLPTMGEVAFSINTADSKWFTYTLSDGTATAGIKASVKNKIGSFTTAETDALTSKATGGGTADVVFKRNGPEDAVKKYIPNFKPANTANWGT